MSETSKLYHTFDPIGIVLSRWRSHVIRSIINNNNARVIDLACGDNRLLKDFPNGTGVDIFNYGNQADLVLKNFESLPFESESVDFVTILAAFNYFDNPVACLKEIKRVLKPDGKILITQLDHNLFKAWHKLRDRKLKRTAYSEEVISDYAKSAGMTIDKINSFMFGVNKVYILKKSSSA